jgi:hypothetical protein
VRSSKPHQPLEVALDFGCKDPGGSEKLAQANPQTAWNLCVAAVVADGTGKADAKD